MIFKSGGYLVVFPLGSTPIRFRHLGRQSDAVQEHGKSGDSSQRVLHIVEFQINDHPVSLLDSFV